MDLKPRRLDGRFVRLEPLAPALKEEMRAALDCDPDAWAILTSSAMGEGFEVWWDEALAAMAAGERIAFAVRRLSDGAVVGTTSYLNLRPVHKGVEIGWTFYRPDARAGAVNPECKLLMLGHAFDAGAVRVELCVDARNARSQAAVLKLGAQREGVLRKHKLTWTGHVRDTVMFSVLDTEWPGVRAGLIERLAERP